jgi:hypothetical protein
MALHCMRHSATDAFIKTTFNQQKGVSQKGEHGEVIHKSAHQTPTNLYLVGAYCEFQRLGLA